MPRLQATPRVGISKQPDYMSAGRVVKDVTETEHLAYIAEKRVEIARVTAELRVAVDELQQIQSQRP